VSAAASACPSCGAGPLRAFFEVRDVPVHSVLLIPTREEALEFPRGDVRLGFCDACAFVANTAFDGSRHDYSMRYEETQGFSGTFNAFADGLARRLVEEYGVQGKTVLEIGCGKGEFLMRMAGLGGNRCIGLDPALVPERIPEEYADKIEVVQEFFTERTGELVADCICCRHTLEHIAPTGEFLGNLRRSIAGRDPLVFIEVPDTLRILEEGAFWDVYYEHCSYFTPGSLARLMRAAGFELLDLWLDFADQYIMLVARPAPRPTPAALSLEADLERVQGLVRGFETLAPRKIAQWDGEVRKRLDAGGRVALWGAGSKAVSFLTTLDVGARIEAVVDINPFKQGRFMPGTGQEVTAPAALAANPPELVIAMNPIYTPEIQVELDRMGLKSELVALT